MKFLKLLLILILASNSYAQTASPTTDWKKLFGKWECKKVILVKGKDSTDISEQYKPYFCTFSADLKYKEDYPYPGTSTTVEGPYKINKSKGIIQFSELVWTTKYSGGKVAVPDVIYKSGKQELYVKMLTPDYLVLLQKYIPKTEAQGDYIFYMKKVK